MRGRLSRVGRGARGGPRGRARRGNRAGDRLVAREPVDVGARRRGRRDGAATAEEAIELTQRSRRELHLGLGRRGARRRAARGWASRRVRSEILLASSGGEELRVHPGWVEADGPGAAHALPAGARRARRGARPARSAPWPSPAGVDLPMTRPGPSGPRRAVALDGGRRRRGRRARACLGESRRRRRSGRRGRARHGCSPGARSRRPATVTRAVAELERAAARSRPAARRATATPPSASCASSAARSTGAPRKGSVGRRRRSTR